ncbi:MAG: hypothetical protein PHO26_06820 [Dehalococcoidia bacterium]|nr:hypothetical protein [Dehalococcoidia bacterium]MDD5495375.1 hypothetical protein [Dehalococcoidia bacterium]
MKHRMDVHHVCARRDEQDIRDSMDIHDVVDSPDTTTISCVFEFLTGKRR